MVFGQNVYPFLAWRARWLHPVNTIAEAYDHDTMLSRRISIGFHGTIRRNGHLRFRLFILCILGGISVSPRLPHDMIGVSIGTKCSDVTVPYRGVSYGPKLALGAFIYGNSAI